MSISWSGVVGGALIDEGEFVVDANIFLFDSVTKSRLATVNGESFLNLAYKRDSADSGHWTSLGWCRDEWGEWDHLQSSD
jgi:hypothetical protein